MTVFASKEIFNDLGLERVRKSHAHASQDCAICLQPLALLPTKGEVSDAELHTATRIASCGHIVGEDCLDAWLEVGHTCPVCNRLLFEPTGDTITQKDINYLVLSLGGMYPEQRIMAAVARFVARQEREHARMRRAYEIEMEKEKKKTEEAHAKNDGFALSDEDFLDSDGEMDFDEADDDEACEDEADEDAEHEAEENGEDFI
jgi:hypothetical protein